MPAELESCVAKVVAEGQDESSAYAICRDSLGLAADGSEDDKPIDMPPEKIDMRVRERITAFSMGDQAVLRKEIVVAHAGRNFVNGDHEFDLTVAEMDQMVRNFTAFPRQVPILLGGDHAAGPDRADRPADGWVEGLKRVGTDLVARVKLMGQAAVAVASDAFRGVSIGAYQPPDLHGHQVGWRLDHLLITNAPFFTDLNIAARATRSGQPRLLYLTASKEATMADDKKKPDTPAPALKPEQTINLSEKITALECLVQEKDGVIRELTAANANLLDEVKAFRQSPQLELAMKELEQQKRVNLANKIRFITARMAHDNQIDMSALRGWYDHDSDEVVLAGFKNSQFKGSLDLIQYHRDTVKKNPGNRTFVSGAPNGDGAPVYTAEQQELIRKHGKDPDLLAKTRGAVNYSEYKRLKQAAQKG